jgi:uncharacterized membrane protein
VLSDQTMLTIATQVAGWFELAGIAAIVLGSVIAVAQLLAGVTGWKHIEPVRGRREPIPAFRKALGRSILTGLELLVAADIIRTVAVEPTLQSVLVLAVIVIIRTFLSMSLEVEIDGRWPWQRAADK